MAEKMKVSCEMEITLKMIGGKCKPLILHYLIENGIKRYNEIQSYVTSIPSKTLTMQLRDMEADGLIQRTVYSSVPPRVEYIATELGKSLYPVLELMCEWGEKNIGDRFEVTNRQCQCED
ncbi:MAG TPA: helix-turn-helix domain-containing protein [Caproiciproducens sp.]|nr:helix-turn-helix domain-containing protein [Caproiciproducens sp.]